jgi:hypothetical protein
MPLMIIYIATCLDNLPSPGKLLLITLIDSASGYNESILNRITIKKKIIRLIIVILQQIID